MAAPGPARPPRPSRKAGPGAPRHTVQLRHLCLALVCWTLIKADAAESITGEQGRVEEFQNQLRLRMGGDSAESATKQASWIPEGTTGIKEPFVLEEEQPMEWQQRRLRRHGLYSFIYYSAYRLSPVRITVVGFGAREFRAKRLTQNCTWIWRNGTQVQGILKHRHTWFNYGKLYELVLLDCWLREGPIAPDLMDWEGGEVESVEPGFLKMKLDNEVLYPYREDYGYKIHPIRSNGPFQYNLAFCSAPLYGEIAPLAVSEWISYHRYHTGMDHFFLYDQGSLTDEILGLLRPLQNQGLITITPFKEILSYDIWAEGQFVAMTDCLYRNRETSHWIAFHDFDEYLEVPPPQTLPGLLKEHEGAAYLTHGCYNYNVDFCEGEQGWAPESGKFVVERMLMRAKEPHCKEGTSEDPEVCVDGFGHRKLIYNPRRVFQTQVHKVEWFLGKGVDLRTSEIRHAHYRGLLIKNRVCHGSKPHTTHSTVAGAHEWENPLYNPANGTARETSVAEIARQARLCEAQGFKNKDKCFPKLPSTKVRRTPSPGPQKGNAGVGGPSTKAK